MSTVLGIAGATFVGGLLLRFRVAPLLMLCIAMYWLVPTVAITSHATGLAALHPAVAMAPAICLVAFIGRAIDRKHHRRSGAARVVALTLVIIAIVLEDYLKVGVRGLGLLMNNVVGPSSVFVAIWLVRESQPRLVQWLIRTLLSLAAFEVGVINLVRLGLVQQPYLEALSTYYWYDQQSSRQLGTTDHPLVLAMLLTLCIPLTIALRAKPLRAALTLLLLQGVVLTESRSGLALGLISALAVAFSMSRNMAVRVVSAVIAAGGSLILLASTLAEGILNRLQDDGGSGLARQLAITEFLRVWQQFLVTGQGSFSNANVGQSLGLATSLENSYLTFAVDYGIPLTLAFFALAWSFVLRSEAPPWRRFAGGLGLVFVGTFSALSTPSAAGFMMWTVLGLVQVNAPLLAQALAKGSDTELKAL